jgi:hypothetical protein
MCKNSLTPVKNMEVKFEQKAQTEEQSWEGISSARTLKIEPHTRINITEYLEKRNMCFTYCYAGRNGNCASAGKDNCQSANCFTLYKNEQGWN